MHGDLIEVIGLLLASAAAVMLGAVAAIMARNWYRDRLWRRIGREANVAQAQRRRFTLARGGQHAA